MARRALTAASTRVFDSAVTPSSPEILIMHDRIRVLFLASNPYAPTAPLRLDEEVRRIDLALRRGKARDALELVSHFAARTGDLQDALLRHQPHVVHFAGHGHVPGIVLGDEHGRPRTVTGEALRGLFGALKGPVRAVVLNGCETLPTVELLSEVVDVAIGMDRPVMDDTAIAFAEAFYGALAMGRTLLAAYELGVSQLEIDGRGDGAVPVLRVRPGADPDAPLRPRTAYDEPSGVARPGTRMRFREFEGKDLLVESGLDGPPTGHIDVEIGSAKIDRTTFRN